MELVGYFGIDSGQVLISDPCYLSDFKDERDSGGVFNAELPKPYPFSYNGACSATCSEDNAGVLGVLRGNEGLGIAVSTGYGDGCYPVYIKKNSEGRVMKIVINFGGTGDDGYEDDDE